MNEYRLSDYVLVVYCMAMLGDEPPNSFVFTLALNVMREYKNNRVFIETDRESI